MAAAVVAEVDDQCIAVALGAEVAMELREARGLHVGHVEVADASVRLRVHPLAIELDPLAIARWHFVGHAWSRRPCGGRFAPSTRELDLCVRLMHEQSLRRHRARQRLPVHRHDALAHPCLDADRVERRIGARVPWIAGTMLAIS